MSRQYSGKAVPFSPLFFPPTFWQFAHWTQICGSINLGMVRYAWFYENYRLKVHSAWLGQYLAVGKRATSNYVLARCAAAWFIKHHISFHDKYGRSWRHKRRGGITCALVLRWRRRSRPATKATLCEK